MVEGGPVPDRLNYVSPLMNNVGYAMAVEKLCGIEITERCKYVRVIISELSRIIDHMVCIGTNMVDLGALTNFWYFWKPREEVYFLIEELCGQRLTTSYTRIGGAMADLPEGWTDRAPRGLPRRDPRVHRRRERPPHEEPDLHRADDGRGADHGEGRGRPRVHRTVPAGGGGPPRPAEGRAVPRVRPVRLRHPDRRGGRHVRPVHGAHGGDAAVAPDHRAGVAQLPGGPINIDDPRFILPEKAQVYENIEALMNHFKFIMEGVKVPAGEVYSATEAANGELGFYIVSRGRRGPYKIKVRPPCFPLFQGIPHLVKGQMIADLIAVLGSVNIIAGELDR